MVNFVENKFANPKLFSMPREVRWVFLFNPSFSFRQPSFGAKFFLVPREAWQVFFYKISNPHTFIIKKKTHGTSFNAERNSTGFFLQPFFHFFFFFDFSCWFGSPPCELNFVENKPTKFLSASGKAQRVFFCNNLSLLHALLLLFFWFF